MPDPLPFGDTFGVSGYPLDQLGVYYSLDGGPLTQVGTTFEYPANIPGFFSRSAKAGILDSNSGTSTATDRDVQPLHPRDRLSFAATA